MNEDILEQHEQYIVVQSKKAEKALAKLKSKQSAIVVTSQDAPFNYGDFNYILEEARLNKLISLQKADLQRQYRALDPTLKKLFTSKKDNDAESFDELQQKVKAINSRIDNSLKLLADFLPRLDSASKEAKRAKVMLNKLTLLDSGYL